MWVILSDQGKYYNKNEKCFVLFGYIKIEAVDIGPTAQQLKLSLTDYSLDDYSLLLSGHLNALFLYHYTKVSTSQSTRCYIFQAIGFCRLFGII